MSTTNLYELNAQLRGHFEARGIGDFLRIFREILAFLQESGITLDQVLDIIRKLRELFGSQSVLALSAEDHIWLAEAFDSSDAGECEPLTSTHRQIAETLLAG